MSSERARAGASDARLTLFSTRTSAFAAHEATKIEIDANQVQRAFSSPRIAAAVWLLARANQLPPLEPRGEGHVGFFHLTIAEHLAAHQVTPDMFDQRHRLEDAWWQTVMISALNRFPEADHAMALDAAAKHHQPLEVGMRVDVFDDDGEPDAAAVICRIEHDAIYCDDEPDEPRRPQKLVRVQSGAAALLRCAAAAGDVRTVQCLVDRGVDAVSSVEEGTKESALHFAARYGQHACVKLLLDLGMNGYAENFQKTSSVQMARSPTIPLKLRHKLSRTFEPDTIDEKIQEMNEYIDDFEDEPGHAFCKLIREDDDALTKITSALKGMKKKKEKHAAINPGRRGGHFHISPFHFAAYYGRLDVMEFLLRNGADKDGPINGRFTALHLASYQGARCDCLHLPIIA